MPARKHPVPEPEGTLGGVKILDVERIKRHIHCLVECSGCGVKRWIQESSLRKTESYMCRRCSSFRQEYVDAMPDEKHRKRLSCRLHSLKRHCYNVNCSRYSSYGARGITVFDEWLDDTPSFLRYIQTIPGWDNPNLSINRIDKDGNYEPGNLRFVDAVAKSNNRRTNLKIPYGERTYSAAQFCRKFCKAYPYGEVQRMANDGLSGEQILHFVQLKHNTSLEDVL